MNYKNLLNPPVQEAQKVWSFKKFYNPDHFILKGKSLRSHFILPFSHIWDELEKFQSNPVFWFASKKDCQIFLKNANSEEIKEFLNKSVIYIKGVIGTEIFGIDNTKSYKENYKIFCEQNPNETKTQTEFTIDITSNWETKSEILITKESLKKFMNSIEEQFTIEQINTVMRLLETQIESKKICKSIKEIFKKQQIK